MRQIDIVTIVSNLKLSVDLSTFQLPPFFLSKKSSGTKPVVTQAF